VTFGTSDQSYELVKFFPVFFSYSPSNLGSFGTQYAFFELSIPPLRAAGPRLLGETPIVQSALALR